MKNLRLNLARWMSSASAITCVMTAAALCGTGRAAVAQGPDSGQPVAGVSLPRPPAPFDGHIGPTAATSTPRWPAPVTAPAHAPNVLLIMTDDIGYAVSLTFGGPVPTPNLDRLAARGA